MHQDVQENTQGPAVYLRERGVVIRKHACVPQAGGLPASLPLQERKRYIVENPEVSASEDHLPLAPRERGVRL